MLDAHIGGKALLQLAHLGAGNVAPLFYGIENRPVNLRLQRQILSFQISELHYRSTSSKPLSVSR